MSKKVSPKKQSRSNYKWVKVLGWQIEELKEEIRDLWEFVVENSRFRLAIEIERCKNCTAKFHDLEPPVIITEGELCEKHKKVVEEFNRRFTSD